MLQTCLSHTDVFILVCTYDKLLDGVEYHRDYHERLQRLNLANAPKLLVMTKSDLAKTIESSYGTPIENALSTLRQVSGTIQAVDVCACSAQNSTNVHRVFTMAAQYGLDFKRRQELNTDAAAADAGETNDREHPQQSCLLS